MKGKVLLCGACCLMLSAQQFAHASENASESNSNSANAETGMEMPGKVKKLFKGLTVGGYGEAVYTRNFYSDNVYRYIRPEQYKNDPSHGRFDIPHAVVYLGYEFGKGWRMQSEIEFEHGGAGSAVEQEFEEAGEWESEVERGGEVELEQFWLEKTFMPQLNLRVGHIVVPVGLNNSHHEPLNFFTVYRPEGENTILPSTWHETGISLWGNAGDWRYEAQFLAGLDAFMFSRDNWIGKGHKSPFEFKVANKYAVAGRIDNTSIPGLRLGISGYFGQSLHNTLPHDMEGNNAQGQPKTYSKYKGEVAIGSFDFTYNDYNWIIRGNFDYGTLADADIISQLKRNLAANNAPYDKTHVGKAAMATGIEAGYDIFSFCDKLRADDQKFYVFGRYEYYDSYKPAKDMGDYPFSDRHRMAVGVNWMPIPQIVVKGEFSKRFLKSQYNDEPSISIGIAYQGFFN